MREEDEREREREREKFRISTFFSVLFVFDDRLSMASSPPSSPLSAAPWLELFDSPHGLGLRVTRDAPAGTALLMERPLAAVTSVGRSRDSSRPRPRPRRRCRRCLALLSLRPPSRIRTCRGCKDSSYCDSDCEEEDKDAHVFSGECELLRRAAEKINEKGETKEAFLPLLREACLALRLLRARPPSAGPLVTHSEELMGGAESGERGRRVWAAAELAARALEAALSPGASGGGGGGGSDADTSHPPPPPRPFEAFHRAASAALCAAIVNSLELRFCDEDEAAGRLDEQKNARARKGKDEDEEDEEDSGLPLAVFAFAARANHSCRPSASFSTRSKGKISLRALRDLRKGEEVTICYLAAGGGGAAMLPLARRRRALQKARCFRCECERCLLEEKLMGEEEEEGGEGGGEGPEASGGDDNGAKGAQAETTAETAAAATAAATRAVLSFLGPCLSAERLLARGETAAIEEGGNAWSAAARALVEAAGEALLRGGSGKSGGGGAHSSEGNTATARATAAATTAAAPFSFAGPPPHSQLFRSARAAAEVCLEAIGGEPNASLLRLIGKIPTTTAPAVATTAAAEEEEEEQEKELETLLRGAAQGSKGDAQSALSLASAAAHASARAAALLGAALGRAHPAAERARFLAFGGGRGDGRGGGNTDEERYAAALPFRVASQVVRLAASLERRQLVGGGGTVN